MTPKYTYLAAWDEMMGSGSDWCKLNQTRASNDHAPLNAIYQDTRTGHWTTFDSVTAGSTKFVIEQIMKRHGWSK